MSSEVRKATPEDVEPMMVLLREMHAENGLAPLDGERVRQVLARGLVGHRAIIGVIRGKGVIEASIGLYVGNWWYSQHEHVEDLWAFVSEPYRKSEHAKSLLQWAKHASTLLERPLLMGVLSNERTAAKIKLYERQLGPAVGALFVVRTVPAVA